MAMEIGRLSVIVLGGMCLLVSGCGTSTGGLIAQLKDEDPAVRRGAARALGRQPGVTESAVAPLANALSDSDLEVRELAAESLGRIGFDAKSALVALTSALKDSEPSVRIAAALAIQKIDPLATSYQLVVIDALRAGNGPVFLAVGKMLGDIRWVIPTLTALLSDRRSQIRALAAYALGSLGPRASDAEAALRRCLRDSEPSVRKAAQNALKQFRPSFTTVKTSR